MAKKHIVGYTHGSLGGHSYGERFDRLENSCEKFEAWFIHTGNTKYTSFNRRSPEDRPGINLTQRGGISLVLRLEDPEHRERITDDHIRFCPFCGAEVELKCTKSVELKRKKKEVDDGYTETITREEKQA